MTKNLLHSQVWILPSTRSQLIKQVNNSQILSGIWKKDSLEPDTLNAPTTLPAPIRPKTEIYRDIQIENPTKTGLGLKFKQAFGYGKLIIRFYKLGVKNVWNNNKQYRQLKNSEFKILKRVDSRGKDVEMKLSGNRLTNEMASVIYMSKIENKTFNETQQNENGVTRHESTAHKYTKEIDENLFNLTRQQYQLIRRTPKDFFKLPIFAVIFAIFVECTPLLCYVFPEITPLTCVLPTISPRLWKSTNMKAVKLLTQEKLQGGELESIAVKTPFNLPIDLVKCLCKSLGLTSRYVPIALYPHSVLRDRLQNHYNYLSVDNYYLSGLNNNGKIWNLNYEELISACLERNLIIDLKKEVAQFDHIEDEAERWLLQKENTSKLQLKLLRHLVDFSHFNVGYLCLNELTPPLDHKLFYKWHTTTEKYHN